jgi:hypothetical protein
MPIVRFVGRLYPLGIEFFIKSKTKATAKHSGSGFEAVVSVDVDKSIMTVECDAREWVREKHLISAYILASDVAGAFVDLAAFMSGIGLNLILEQIIEPDGNMGPIMPIRNELMQKSIPGPGGFDDKRYDKILPVILRNREAIHALRDLVDGFTHPHMTAISCGRALEGMRHAVAPNRDRPVGWARLRDVIQVDQNYLKLITDESKGPRHGDFASVTSAANAEISKRTWIIAERFLEFLVRGGKDPLPLSEFPLLLG